MNKSPIFVITKLESKKLIKKRKEREKCETETGVEKMLNCNWIGVNDLDS